MIYALVFLLYAAALVALSLYLSKKSDSDFVMGGRNASSIFVGGALFSLIGGGELVTLTSLAAVYGLPAISLFAGYALGFIFLALSASRIRAQSQDHFVSIPDFISHQYGKMAGKLVFLVSFLAFFSMLVLQFVAGGQILGALAGWQYHVGVLAIAGVTLVYLLIGGFKTVLWTDIIQGGSRLLLMPLLLFALVGLLGAPRDVATRIEPLPPILWASFIITGIFAAIASADVWQRIFAAKDADHASRGLWIGAGAMLAFGGMLVALGILALSAGVASSPETAFIDTLSVSLPLWAQIVAVVLVLSTIMGTADTELFMLSSMAAKGFKDEEPLPQKVRMYLAVIGVFAVGVALAFDDLILVYTWLLTALVAISPIVVASIFGWSLKPYYAAGLVTLSVATFAGLAFLGILTLETAFYVLLPNFIFLLTARIADASLRNNDSAG